MLVSIAFDREKDGRWIAEATNFPGVLVYGATKDAALENLHALLMCCIADRLEHGEFVPGMAAITLQEVEHGRMVSC